MAVLVAIERSMACLSATATMLLLLTFLFFRELRTLPNTLIFLASPANLLASSAALIGGNGFNNLNGPTCQGQAFLLEWFEQSDPYWSCAASITVLLIFFFRWGADRIKRLYWLYCVLCYGIPLVAAIVCLVYNKTCPMYGNAILWCWIDEAHAWTRFYSFYGPVWVTMIISISVYVVVGVHVYKARSQLHEARQKVHCGSASVAGRSSTFPGPSPVLTGHSVDVENRAASIKYPEPIYSPPTPTSSTPITTARSSTYTVKDISSYSRRFLPLSFIATIEALLAFSLADLRLTLKGWESRDEVKYKYTKSALLFTISILIT
ncbi:hypothetical protein EG329_007878, partial [Mollisiaceae sp. DMI_Dod_QoI]